MQVGGGLPSVDLKIGDGNGDGLVVIMTDADFDRSNACSFCCYLGITV